MNKIVEVKKLIDEKNRKKPPDNVISQKHLINSVDASTINHNKNNKKKRNRRKKNKQNSPNNNPTSNSENVIINKPLSYLTREGKIHYSKLLVDEVLAADKLLIEAAKLTSNIAGDLLN